MPCYAVGQELGTSEDGLSCKIPTPGKALRCRLVLSRGLPMLSRPATRQWLLEDLRCETE
jgi:hypothetical protein